MTTRWRRGALVDGDARGWRLAWAPARPGKAVSWPAPRAAGATSRPSLEEQTFEETAPGLLAASGNALLPGGRIARRVRARPAPLSLSTSPLTANVDASANLLNGAAVSANLASSLGSVRARPVTTNIDASAGLLNGAAVSANLASPLAAVGANVNLGGPLLALNGSQAALLGVGVTGPTILGATPNLTANLGTVVNPATAATQTLISATVGATQTPTSTPSPGSGTPGSGTPGTVIPPLLPPILGVPGTTPLQTLLPLLRPTTTTPPLPGLFGN
jgi:hypothetical protein